MPPAARISDLHVCPAITVLVPHVGGPVLTRSMDVFIVKQTAARETDVCVCTGPPDAIAKGSTTVQINNLPAARMGDPTLHGGKVALGWPTVVIGG